MTGTAVNPCLRAAYMAHCTTHQVPLTAPARGVLYLLLRVSTEARVAHFHVTCPTLNSFAHLDITYLHR